MLKSGKKGPRKPKKRGEKKGCKVPKSAKIYQQAQKSARMYANKFLNKSFFFECNKKCKKVTTKQVATLGLKRPRGRFIENIGQKVKVD